MKLLPYEYDITSCNIIYPVTSSVTNKKTNATTQCVPARHPSNRATPSPSDCARIFFLCAEQTTLPYPGDRRRGRHDAALLRPGSPCTCTCTLRCRRGDGGCATTCACAPHGILLVVSTPCDVCLRLCRVTRAAMRGTRTPAADPTVVPVLLTAPAARARAAAAAAAAATIIIPRRRLMCAGTTSGWASPHKCCWRRPTRSRQVTSLVTAPLGGLASNSAER